MVSARPRRDRRRLDGVLLLDKPTGMTSNAALQAAKRLFGALKAGHTGTLDPLASGLLPLCFGEATKFAQALLDADKCYHAGVQLGVRTDSGDAEGEVVSRRDVNVSPESLAAALERFTGEIEQIPPMHSALKRGGRPLYELARQGIVVPREARLVRIHGIELLAYDGSRVEIAVHCSKGTYIRALADDLGEALGCGAHLAALRRVATGGFDLRDAHDLEHLAQMSGAERDGCLLAVDTLVAGLPRIELDALHGRLLLQGRALDLVLPGDAQEWRAYDDGGRFLGVAMRGSDGRLTARRLVATGGDAAMPPSPHT